MKKVKLVNHRLVARGNVVPKTVDEYLAGIPEPARTTLNKVRSAIRSALPSEATETISYRMPAFKYKGSMICFAAFKDHCSLFPGASVIEAFKNELGDFRTSKGTVQFPVDKPPSVALLKKLVKARIAENESQKER